LENKEGAFHDHSWNRQHCINAAQRARLGLACCRSAAVSCDLRDTRTGIGGGGFGDAVWM
jgi:hypothetical protein